MARVRRYQLSSCIRALGHGRKDALFKCGGEIVGQGDRKPRKKCRLYIGYARLQSKYRIPFTRSACSEEKQRRESEKNSPPSWGMAKIDTAPATVKMQAGRQEENGKAKERYNDDDRSHLEQMADCSKRSPVEHLHTTCRCRQTQREPDA